jgi:hypothetical protein
MSISMTDGNVQGLFLLQLTINPASVAAVTTAEQTFTVNGLRASDIAISASMLTASAGLGIAGVRVSAENTLALTFVNPTAGAIDAASGLFNVLIARPNTPTLLGGLS